MITLVIDTSSSRTCIGLLLPDHRADSLYFERLPSPDGNGMDMFRAIPELLARHHLQPRDVDLWAVGIGPGSFTGIRAGIAAAQGLALPHRKPLKTVVSFDAVALAALPSLPADCAAICVISDARRDEIYHALYDQRGRRVGEVQLGAVEELVNMIHHPVWFVSAEMDRYREELKSVLGGFAVVSDTNHHPDAAAMARLALERYRRDPSPDVAPAPLYLRPTQYKVS